MYSLLKGTWALFFGVAMIMLANGLQGSLIGVRASIEGYSAASAGIILTGYYAGFLSGALLIPRRIKSVGHVRMFAALASIASISILLHSIHVSFFGWFLMRFISGMCFVGMYTVAESWINDRSENNNRGMRRSHLRLKGKNFIEDKESGEMRLSHHVDMTTGTYNGKKIFTPKAEK